MRTVFHSAILHSLARMLMPAMLAGGVMYSEETQVRFAEQIATAGKASESGDFALFRSSMHDAITIATDGIQDPEQLRSLYEALSAFPVITHGTTAKDAYVAWLDSVKEILSFSDAGAKTYPVSDAPGVLQSQADIALLLLKVTGLPYLDTAKDPGGLYQKQLEIVGSLLGRLKSRIKDKSDAPLSLYALTPEASQALLDSKEPFLMGGDPQLINDKKARELVQRDYDKNLKEADIQTLQEFLKRATEKIQREAVISAKKLIETKKVEQKAAINALSSPSVPRSTWEKLLADGA